MTTPAPEQPRLGKGTGLVVMLDLAGETIAALEARVDLLEEALIAERRERARIEDMLARLRASDTATVHTSPPPSSDDGPHEPDPARTS